MRTLRLLIIALTVTLLAGCGGKGGGTTGGSPLSSTETISQSGSTQVRASVKVLPTNGTVTVTRLTDSSASFTGTFALSPGDVLVSNKGDLQFARKVVSVSRSGDITTVETAPITLSDVFSSADLERVETVAPAAFANVPALLPGETIGPATKRPGKLAYTIPITFQNTYVTGLNGEPGIIIDGRVDIDVTFDTVLKTNWFGAVRELKIVPTVKAVGQVTATAQAGMTFKRSVPITPTVKIPLTPLGPLTLTIDLQLNLDVSAKLAGKLTQQASGSVTAAAGPWYRNGKWSLERVFNYDFNIPPPVVEAEASIWISAGQPRFAVTVLGIASAWIKADVAKAGAEVKVVALPTPGVSGQAKLIFGGAAGVSLLFFGSQELGSFAIGPYDIGPSFFYTFPQLYDMVVRAIATVPQLRVGEVLQLEVEGRRSAGADTEPIAVTWTQKSSNGGSVAFGPHNEVQGVTPGFVTVTATQGGQSVSYDLTVTSPSVSAIAITGDLSPRESAELDLRAVARFTDGSTKDVTELCSWTSGDTAVLTVEDGGRDYAVKQGTTTVSATYVDFAAPASARTAQASISVRPANVIDFQLEQPDVPGVMVTSDRLQVGEVVRYQAVGFVADASQRDLTDQLTWTSLAPAVASVDPDGTVRALSAGYTTIVVSDPATGHEDRIDLTVSRPAVSSVALAASGTTLAQGQTVQLQANATLADATTANVTQASGVQWFSGDPSVATVSASGLVTGVNAGIVTVYTVFQRRQASLTLQVVGPERLSFATSPPSTIQSGVPGPIDIAIVGSDGNVFTAGSPTVTLSLPDGTSGVALGGTPLAVTASNGHAVFSNVTLTGAGTVRIIATANGLTTAQTATITVTP